MIKYRSETSMDVRRERDGVFGDSNSIVVAKMEIESWWWSVMGGRMKRTEVRMLIR